MIKIYLIFFLFNFFYSFIFIKKQKKLGISTTKRSLNKSVLAHHQLAERVVYMIPTGSSVKFLNHKCAAMSCIEMTIPV